MTAYILTLQYFRINSGYRNCGAKSTKNLSYESTDLRGLYIRFQIQKVNTILAPESGKVKVQDMGISFLDYALT
jgi:hypothetical protein